MGNNKTAVEWLWVMLLKGEFINDPDELFQKAKEMEKQQIMDAWDNGAFNLIFETAEQYYNEEYGSKESDKCCTPPGQIKRYIDCIGCDRKPKTFNNNEQQ